MAPSNITKMYLFHFFQAIHFYGAISVPFFLDWLNVSYTKMFLLQAWFSLCLFALEIPTGVVADKYGRKTSLILGMLCTLIFCLIFGTVNSYYVLFIAEFIGAAGLALFSGADKALLYDTLLQEKRKNKKEILSKYEAAGTAALVIGFPIGSLFVASSIMQYPASLPMTFLLSAGSATIALIIALSIQEPKRKTQETNFIQSGIKGFKTIFQHKTLRAFALNSTLIGATTFFIFWFYQPLSEAAGIPLAYYGFIGAGFNLFGVLLLLNVTRIERLLDMKTVLLYTALIPGIFFISVAYIKLPLFVLISIFLITGLKLLRQPILIDYMNQHIESANRATVLSGISMLERIIIFLLYPLVGLLADISLNYALISLGVITVLFALVTRIETSHITSATGLDS